MTAFRIEISNPLQFCADVTNKAASKPGMEAGVKAAAFWDNDKTDVFLRAHKAYWNKYRNSRIDALWNDIRCHIWFRYGMAFSMSQLKEKLKGLRSYFNGTIMKTAAEKDGTSSYPHYKRMLQVYPLVKGTVEANALNKAKDQSLLTNAGLSATPLPSGSTSPHIKSKSGRWCDIPASMGRCIVLHFF